MVAVLDERERTHGPFENTAIIAQAIKGAMREATAWDNMDPLFREALDMIASKMARIANGHPYEPDHWRDIAGYAELAIRAIDELTPE